MKSVYYTASLITLVLAGNSNAASTSVTCTNQREITYQGSLQGVPTFEQKRLIYKKYPDSMCAFMSNEDTTPTKPIDSNPLTEKVPDVILRGGASEDLAAALSRISSGNTGTPFPVDITKEVANYKTEASQGEVKPYVEHTINLTIGIYRSVPTKDVIAHWKEMQEVGESLKGLTPTLTNVNNITMLSVENIPDNMAEKVCKDSESRGIGCVAYY